LHVLKVDGWGKGGGVECATDGEASCEHGDFLHSGGAYGWVFQVSILQDSVTVDVQTPHGARMAYTAMANRADVEIKDADGWYRCGDAELIASEMDDDDDEGDGGWGNWDGDLNAGAADSADEKGDGDGDGEERQEGQEGRRCGGRRGGRDGCAYPMY
jgi:hypothetical protein